ncbi:MAG: dihydrofolate reductase [Flavobacteriales bacterium]|nr:dihydrofolate reductase [Flavobacteriales bacterium]
MIISAIAAVADNGTIGIDGDLPWHLPDDLKYFQRITMGHPVITGRKNYESIPEKYRPLRGRVNIVVTRNPRYEAPGARVCGSINEAIALATELEKEEVFVIGGGELYRAVLQQGLIDRLYLTLVHADIAGDTSFPMIDPADWLEVERTFHGADEQHAFPFSFVVLERA